MKRLAFLSALATVAFAAAPAFADEALRVEHAPNPGFVYQLVPGSAAGTVVVRIGNAGSATQTVYRTFPTAENTFQVTDLDPQFHHVRRRPAPATYGRLTSSGTSLAPGESSDAQLDLNRSFVLVPGHRYRIRASTDLRFGPADRIVVTSLSSNEITIDD